MFAGPAAVATGVDVAATPGVAAGGAPSGAAGGAPSGAAAALSCANALPEPASIAEASAKAELTTKRTVRFVIFLLRLTYKASADSYKPGALADAGGGLGRRLLGQFGFESQFRAVTMRQR